MKFLTILIAMILTGAIIAFLSAYACGGSASTNAWITSNASYAYSGISAYDVKRGGYSISCTGNTTRALAYSGTTNDWMSIWYDYRTSVSAEASVGGSCHGGGGFQDYDSDSASP